MELALLVQLVLLQLHLTPLPPPAAAPITHSANLTPAAAAGTRRRGKTAAAAAKGWQALLPQHVQELLVFGLGALGGAQQQAAQWRESGDPQGLLPAANLLRLVGFKVPQEPWWLAVTPRRQS
jgi:hypothetical protein